MARPSFTDAEERLLLHIRLHDRTAPAVVAQWLPWLALALASYAYGCWRGVPECRHTGFAVAFLLLLRVVYYQSRPSWRLQPIVAKYEAACAGNAASPP